MGLLKSIKQLLGLVSESISQSAKTTLAAFSKDELNRLRDVGKTIAKEFSYRQITGAAKIYHDEEWDSKDSGHEILGFLQDQHPDFKFLLKAGVLNLAARYSRRDHEKPEVIKFVHKYEIKDYTINKLILAKEEGFLLTPQEFDEVYVIAPTSFEDATGVVVDHKEDIEGFKTKVHLRPANFENFAEEADVPMLLLSYTPGRNYAIQNARTEAKDIVDKKDEIKSKTINSLASDLEYYRELLDKEKRKRIKFQELYEHTKKEPLAEKLNATKTSDLYRDFEKSYYKKSNGSALLWFALVIIIIAAVFFAFMAFTSTGPNATNSTNTNNSTASLFFTMFRLIKMWRVF